MPIQVIQELTHPHVDVLGVNISAIDMDMAVRLSDDLISSKKRGYICVTGVHGVMEAQSDAAFLDILNSAFINTPDGMPMSWIGHLRGHKNMNRVYGPDFMTEMCKISVDRGYRNFLYGGNDGIAALLKQKLMDRFPGLQIVGTYTPPFRALDIQEEDRLLALVREAHPDIFWVGLSTPKQEQFMAQYIHQLNTYLMVGVGAAFDIHTGKKKDAPDWVKRCGLQWLHRMLQEPKRLGPRYLMNNPRFVTQIILQFLGIRNCRKSALVSER
jgi:N-acetylglucosaminyldiphosphoundecaprenol N-acetyl-beta-D-mannosaminyltransferase